MFVKGNPGRPKGIKNKIKPQTLSDFLVKHNINIVEHMWQAVMSVENAAMRTKLLTDMYKYIEAPKVAKIEEAIEESEQAPQLNQPSSVLQIVTKDVTDSVK